jgi:kumamolisin
VGGTRLVASGTTSAEEVVWNDGRFATGGGVSSFFQPPAWQKQVKLPGPARGTAAPGRGIPDVAAHADPAFGYRVVVDGKSFVAGGTGASAALWGGLIALINEGVGRNVGFINPVLYEQAAPAGAFRSITSGDNGVNGVKGYPAGPGWNASAGWGSPNGRKLLAVLRDASTARRQ